jgi:hypothetical protein
MMKQRGRNHLKDMYNLQAALLLLAFAFYTLAAFQGSGAWGVWAAIIVAPIYGALLVSTRYLAGVSGKIGAGVASGLILYLALSSLLEYKPPCVDGPAGWMQTSCSELNLTVIEAETKVSALLALAAVVTLVFIMMQMSKKSTK